MKKPRWETKRFPQTFSSSNCNYEINVNDLKATDTSSVTQKPKRLTRKQRAVLGMSLLAEAAKLLGWQIAVPKRGKYVHYVVLGGGRPFKRVMRKLGETP